MAKILVLDDVSDAAHLAVATAEMEQVELETYLISGDYRTAELDVVDPHEVDDLVLGVLHRSHQQHPTDLSHRLDDQDAWHDGMLGEMALEERLVDSHVLDPNDPLTLLHLHDAVHKEHGIPVRDHAEDLLDAHHRRYLEACSTLDGSY